MILNGGLSNSVTREEILNLFQNYENTVNIMMPPGKPYCFVSFAELTEAQRAKHDLHGFKLNRSCVMTPCIIYTDFVKTGLYE